MSRPYQRSAEFVEDLYALRGAGYTYKKDYAHRMGISETCFDMRLVRARRLGLLPPGRFTRTFNPFGDQNGY